MTSESAGSVWARRLDEGPEFSCALGWGPGQALESFWRDLFGRVRPGAQVLEIGCGSADVSIWAAEARRGLKILATDLHDNASGVRRHPDVRFQGGAPAEALPVPDQSFDFVASNFAIEYSPRRDQALAELVRVMRPGGGAMLVLHSTDSTITAMSLLALKTHAALVRAEVPEKVRQAAALRPDHLSRRKLLKEVLKFKDGFPRPPLSYSGVEYFDLAERLLGKDPAARQEAERLEEAIAMRLEISREQASVALDEAALAALLDRLRSFGLKAHASDLTCSYSLEATEKVAWLAAVSKG